VTTPPPQAAPTTAPAAFRCTVFVRALPPYGNGRYEIGVTASNVTSAWLVVISGSSQQLLPLRLRNDFGAVPVYSPTQAPVVLVYGSYETRADQLGCRTPE